MIEQATIDKIVDAANVVEVISDFVSLRKRGANYMACCPFHEEKTPSFSVSPAKGIYKCFGCGKAGNSVTFVMEHESLTYIESLKYLAKKYGIEVVEREESEEQIKIKDERESMMIISAYAQEFFSKTLNSTTEGKAIGLSYFKERGFTKEIIKKFELGYSPEDREALLKAATKDGYKEEFLVKTGLCIETSNNNKIIDRFSGRVIFPIHSLSGRVIAFGGRTLRTDKKVAKYLNSPESNIYLKRNTLYGIFFAKQSISKLDKCYLVEGYTDVMSMHQSGILNVVASSGTSLTSEQIKLITRFSNNVTVLFDGDAAGIKASLRGIDMLLEQGVKTRIVLLPSEDDPDSFAKRHSEEELKEYLEENEQDFLSFKIKLLLKDSENDPIKKTEVIKDVVKSIAVIPDVITRSVYVKQSAKDLEIEEEILRLEIAKLRKERISTIVKQEKEAEKTPSEPASPVIPSFVSNIFCEENEKELLKYMLKDGREKLFKADDESSDIYVDEYIIAELKNDDLELQNLHYKQIFEEYDNLLKTNPDKDISKHFFNHENPRICNLTINLLSEKYELSKIWDKSKPLFRLQEAIPKAIAAYKSKIVIMAIKDLMEKLKNSEGDPKEICEHLALLHQQRKIFSELLGRPVM